MPATPTCLFTGVALSPTTKVEHTIPESVGGRITSRLVTCDAFNEKAGKHIDYTLKLVYEPMLNVLSPLLPRTFQAGKMQVDVPGEASGLVMEQGRLSRDKPIITKDDEGKPLSVSASNRKPIDQIARSLGKDPAALHVSSLPATTSPVFLKKVPVICRDVELAALKAALTTFDVLLSHSDLRFTRLPACEQARRLLHSAVINNHIERDLLGSISLGLQYEKLGLYQRIRAKCGVPVTPFEHVMYVASYPASKCLDIVWNVFGVDPFGFRLSTEWRGDCFGYVFVNPILSDTHPSEPIPFTPTDELLCLPTERRSLPQFAKEDEMRNILDLVSSERRRSYADAVQLVEMSADQHIAECMKENAQLATGMDKSAQSQIMLRLGRMFGRKQHEEGFRTEIARIVAGEMQHRPELAAISDFEAASDSEVRVTIAAYRECLKNALTIIGPLGDAFQNSVGIIVDPSDQRLLGALPPMM